MLKTSRANRTAKTGRTGRIVGIIFLALMLPLSAGADFFGVAHRGGRVHGPENTLEVFQLTMNLGVTPWLETDAWVSSDGVLVLHHDRNMCRTTNIATFPGYDCVVAANNPLGRFPEIRDFTLAELKALDVGSWFSPAFVGTTMPTLEEALVLLDGTGFSLLVDIKVSFQAPLYEEILTRTGIDPDTLIIWARQAFTFNQFYTIIPNVRQVTGLLSLAAIDDAFLMDRVSKGDYGIGMVATDLTQELVDLIHSYGLITYSVPGTNGQDPVSSQIPKGIDAIHVTDELGWVTFLAGLPCLDRVDNEGDGFGDFDGIDFDLDGIHEIPPDPACTARLDVTEVAECQDGIDNDMDGFIDLADSACLTPNSLTETVFIPSCGDGLTTPPETCDDGNVIPGDGCYSSCMIEASATFYGVASGGSVAATISGVTLVVTTNPGETAAQVVVSLEVAINTDLTLQGLGISATAIGDSFYTDGTIDSLTLSDPGLSLMPLAAPVPGLNAKGLLVLALSLAGCGAWIVGRFRRRAVAHS